MRTKIAVTDACIFIDLYNLTLIAPFFDLEMEIHTTSSVYFELYSEQQQVLHTYQSVNKLTIHNMQEEDFLEIHSASYPKSLSLADKSVLYIANRLDACVLSSDRTLRSCAKNRSIECHGMIWIFDKLVESGSLPTQDAVVKLKQLIATNFIFQNNQSLVNEIRKRLNLWSDV